MGNIQKINGNFITATTASSVSTLNQDVTIIGSLTNTGTSTITGSVVITGSFKRNMTSLVAASNTASIDFGSGGFFALTLANSANILIRPTNITPGQTVYIRVTQNGVGLGTASFPSSVKQPSGSLYTGSQVLNAVDVLTLTTFDSTNVYLSTTRNLV